MLSREKILRKLAKAEDRQFISKVIDKAQKAESANCILFTDFMDPYQRSLVEKALAGEEQICFAFNGGYEGAERVVAVFCPINMSFEECKDFKPPFRILNVKQNTRENLSHRDYLGALMASGIKREKIGDIIVREDSCDIVVLGEIADYILYSLDKVGNVKVETSVTGIENLQHTEPWVKIINGTVASLRLDCVSGIGFGISRSKMSEFIKAEKVNLNWEMIDCPSKQVKEGDTITIRGKGRVVVEKVGGTTKKGRIAISLKKYL